MNKAITECKHFETCEAPLCPLDDNLDSCIWYSDEEICRSSIFKKLQWIRIQKRLRKRQVSADGFFTKFRLNTMYACSPQTKGANPDSRINMKWVDPYTETEIDPMPFLHSYGKPEKRKEGHCSVNSREPVLV